MLHQPTLFEEFVRQSPSVQTTALLHTVQAAHRKWTAGSPRAVDGEVKGPQLSTPVRQTALRQQALAVAYAHRVRERFAASPPHYSKFMELVAHYEEARASNDAMGEMGEILNAALLGEIVDRLAALFGEQHGDLVSGFRACIPSACVAAAAAAS